MYVNNTNILLLIYNVYNYDYSFGENKNKRALLVKLKVILCAYEHIFSIVRYIYISFKQL